MKFNIINLETWARKSHFEFHMQGNGCTFNITKNIDITNLIAFSKINNYKFYPVFIYIVSKAINEIEELKIRIDETGKIGYFDYISPAYPVFHDDDKTFSGIYTEYNENLVEFYRNVITDIDKYKNIKGICAKPSPENYFNISCIPWLDYTGFALQICCNYLVPIVTWGKYINYLGKTELPLTLQVHHAIADGYHASMFINLVQKLALDLSYNK